MSLRVEEAHPTYYKQPLYMGSQRAFLSNTFRSVRPGESIAIPWFHLIFNNYQQEAPLPEASILQPGC
jgi:hypothetical protein